MRLCNNEKLLKATPVAVLDTATNTVTATVAFADFFIAGLAISPDGRHAYLAERGRRRDHQGAEHRHQHGHGRDRPGRFGRHRGLPDGKQAYATDFDGIAVIDTSQRSVHSRIPVDKGTTTTVGRGISFSPDGTTAYLANGGFHTVAVIDTATKTVAATIDG